MVFVKFHNMNREKMIFFLMSPLNSNSKIFTLQQVKTILQSQFTNVQFSFLLFSIYVLSILLKRCPFFLSFFLSICCVQQCSNSFLFFFSVLFPLSCTYLFLFFVFIFFFIINCSFNVLFFPTLYLLLSVFTLTQ